ncbi:hypothetical protein SAMN05421835_101776 [Amycolatopsis sacchari]|uniref:Lysylphosphatidylglycerol synthase TM region n=1 Tax=Amycolatopsis sacchari TaxID=115433 RepID=A0A1I3L1F1_9PSEU|nr:lysylphosphatidylglycerol synthase transmembrane domain-containing protein [Amycolatopsis sacchari]SFI78458.1 hypothetical protein SAMN05421835_101776 [Amycolatopsis sacchari]
MLREALRTARRPAVRLVLDVVLAAGGIGIAVWRVAPALTTVGDFGTRFAAVRWQWVALAVAAALSSLAAYGELHRRLLVTAGARVPVGTVQAVNFAGNAIAQTMPSAGSTAGAAYTVAALRARGVDTAASLWSATVAALLSAAVLVVPAPAMLAGAGVLGWPAALGLVALFAALAVLGSRLVHRPAAAHWAARRVFALVRHVPALRNGRWVHAGISPLDELLGRLARFRPSARAWSGFASWALLSWALDYVALVACVLASASTVPWLALAAGYLAVQVSIGIQLTPAGAGPAETGLLAALVAGGLAAPGAALAVVLYRAITWLGLTAAGWLVFAVHAVRTDGR